MVLSPSTPGFFDCVTVGSARMFHNRIPIKNGLPIEFVQRVVSPHGFALVGLRRFIVGVGAINVWWCIGVHRWFPLRFEKPFESFTAG